MSARSSKTQLRRAAALAGAAVATAAIAGAVGGTATAAPRESKPTTVCSANIGDPVIPGATTAVAVQVNQFNWGISAPDHGIHSTKGRADFSTKTAPAFVSHTQTVRYDWKNLDTRKSGSVTTKATVGPDSSLAGVAKDVRTGSGRVQVTANITKDAGPLFGSASGVQKKSCTGTFRVA